MNRLFQWLYAKAFGLRTVTIDQHIADLQRVIDELSADRQAIDAELDNAIERMCNALEQRDAIAKSRQQTPFFVPQPQPAQEIQP